MNIPSEPIDPRYQEHAAKERQRIASSEDEQAKAKKQITDVYVCQLCGMEFDSVDESDFCPDCQQ